MEKYQRYQSQYSTIKQTNKQKQALQFRGKIKFGKSRALPENSHFLNNAYNETPNGLALPASPLSSHLYK